ncbi:MAG: exosortase-dependent surface protein XDP2 [Cyanobacteria bacterium P01_D01_bin.50]
MKFNKLVTSIGLTVGTVLFASNSAQAADFTSNLSQNTDSTKDILLESITQKNKQGVMETFREFSYVYEADIEYNDEYKGGNSGAISTDHGDNVQMEEISRIEGLNDYSKDHEDNVVDFLGNNNLNKIIDTEDKGTFTLNLFFKDLIKEDKSGLDSLFFFERGMNSNLLIQALDSDGNTIGDQLFLKGKNKQIDQSFANKLKDNNIKQKNDQKKAGYQINTKEIGGSQQVGSWGVSLAELGVDSLKGVQIYASGHKYYQGPDFKVIARQSSYIPDINFSKAAKVPEPGTIIGLGSVAALAFIRRRKSK